MKVKVEGVQLSVAEVAGIFKLQALVYDILPSTTAVFSYAIGSRKLSANEQFFFFVGAQTVLSLLQTTQIKPKSFESRQNSFCFVLFLPGVDASHVYVHAWALGRLHSITSTQTFGRALTASVDRCAEIKSAPSMA